MHKIRAPLEGHTQEDWGTLDFDCPVCQLSDPGPAIYTGIKEL